MSVALSPDLSATDIRLSKPQPRAKPGDITGRNAAADAFALLLTEAEILAVPVAPSPLPDTARTPVAIATPAAPHLPRPIADQPSEFTDVFDTCQRHLPEEGAILPLPGNGLVRDVIEGKRHIKWIESGNKSLRAKTFPHFGVKLAS